MPLHLPCRRPERRPRPFPGRRSDRVPALCRAASCRMQDHAPVGMAGANSTPPRGTCLARARLSPLGRQLRLLTLGLTVAFALAALFAVARLRVLERSVTEVLSHNYR